MTDKKKKESAEKNRIIKFISFKIDEREFGIPVSRVEQIIPEPDITPIPRSPSFLLGIMNLRGNIIPVIDLKRRLDIEHDNRSPSKGEKKCLVVHYNHSLSSIIVDSVYEVQRVEEDRIQGPPQLTQGVKKAYLTGIVKYKEQKRLVMMLSLSEILDIHIEGEGAQGISGLLKSGSRSVAHESREKEEQYVTFFLDNEEFAIPIHSIFEILKPREITPVPNVPSFVLGIQNIRGVVIPIISTRILTGKSPVEKEIKRLFNRMEQGFSGYCADVEEVWKKNATVKNLPEKPEEMKCYRYFKNRKQILKHINHREDEYRDALQAAILLSPFTGGREEEEIAPEKKTAAFREQARKVKKIIHQTRDDFLKAYHKNQRVLIVSIEGMSVGLMVDTVRSVVKIPLSLVDTTPAVISTYGDEIHGVAKLEEGKRLVMIFDPKKLVSKEDVKLLSEIRKEEKKDKEEAIRKETHRFVVFSIEGEEFGVSIDQVQEIFVLEHITPVPSSQKFIRGLANLRGSIIPVIDVRERFGIASREEKQSMVFSDLLKEFNRWIRNMDSAVATRNRKKGPATIPTDRFFRKVEGYQENSAPWLKERLSKIMPLARSLEQETIEMMRSSSKDRDNIVARLDTLKKQKIRSLRDHLKGMTRSGGDHRQGEKNKLLVVNLRKKQIGLMVEDVNEVLGVYEDQIRPAPSLVVSSIESNYIQSILKLKGGERIVLVLKISKIMSASDYRELIQKSRGKQSSSEKKESGNRGKPRLTIVE